MSDPVITNRWLGGNRIKIDRLPPEPPNPRSPFPRPTPGCVRFRVFAGSVIERYPSGRSAPTAHSGPRSARTVRIDDLPGGPDIESVRRAISALHRRWPALWFYDCTGLDIAAQIPAERAYSDDWLPAGADSWDET